jgi:hypothetical protein
LRSSGRTGRSGTDFALPACSMHAVRLGRFLGDSFLVVCVADVPVSDCHRRCDEVGLQCGDVLLICSYVLVDFSGGQGGVFGSQ